MQITIFEIIAWFEDRQFYVRFEKLKKKWSIPKDLFVKSSFVRDSVLFIAHIVYFLRLGTLNS